MGFFLNQDSAEVIKVMASRFARELAQISIHLRDYYFMAPERFISFDSYRVFYRRCSGSPHTSPSPDVGIQFSIWSIQHTGISC